ncbi:MAG: hypothetical protein DYG92_14655 [Leptolyngbya sp. PLA1]|nr:hypothetical protein [Leptolyngbya sp. PLA1]
MRRLGAGVGARVGTWRGLGWRLAAGRAWRTRAAFGEGDAEELRGGAARGFVAAGLGGDGGETRDEFTGAIGEEDAGAEEVDVCDDGEVGLDVRPRAPVGEVGEGEASILKQDTDPDAGVEKGVEDGAVGVGEARGGVR